MKPQDSLSAEERVLAEQLARLGPHGEPSPALDARILAAAHAEVSRPSTVRKPRWPVAIGLAASALLAVGVAWQLRPVDEAPLISGPPSGEQTAAAAMTESADEPAAAAELADTDAALARQEAQASVEAPPPVRALQEPVQAPAPAPPAQAVSKPRPRPEAQARRAIRPTPPAEAKSSPAPVVARRQSAPAPAAIADQVDSETVALPLPPPAPASASAPASQARAASASKPASDAEVSSARAETTDSYRIRNSAADASAARTQAYEQRAVAGEGQALDRVAVTGSRLQRTDLQVPVHDDARLATDEWLERIRLRRDLGDGASAAASLRLYVQEHPFRKVPEDLRPLLAE
jgi:hypothetical protein